MRLHILDDDRPGYARLAFDAPHAQATLSLSAYSHVEGGFLGPNGKWQRTPHFFNAQRIGGDAHSTIFRVGPEIVNHLLELDSIEFASPDGSLRAVTTWENAVPQMPSRQKVHTIYRKPDVRPAALQPGPQEVLRAPEPEVSDSSQANSSEPNSSESKSSESKFSNRQREEPPAQATFAQEELMREGHAASLSGADPERSKSFLARHRGLLIAGLGVIALIALWFGIRPFLPCEWFGNHCMIPGDAEAAQKARLCAVDRMSGGRDCEIGQECIAPYLAKFAKGEARAELEDKRKSADEICRQMTQRMRGVYQCIDDLKAQHRPCDIKAACIQNFQSLYRAGPLRQEIDRAAAQAQDECRGLESDRASEDLMLNEARACAADANRNCGEPGCYAPYLHQYGFTGIHHNEAQGEAADETLEKEEQDALNAARQCARGQNRCAAPGCYADYLAKFASGKYRSEGQAEAAEVEQDCRNEHQQVVERSPVADGRYSARAFEACGAKQRYFPVEVKGSHISWEHELQGLLYHWDGTIDPTGMVMAKVAGIAGAAATGHFTESGDKTIAMKYPQCAQTIPMEIRHKLQ